MAVFLVLLEELGVRLLDNRRTQPLSEARKYQQLSSRTFSAAIPVPTWSVKFHLLNQQFVDDCGSLDIDKAEICEACMDGWQSIELVYNTDCLQDP